MNKENQTGLQVIGAGFGRSGTKSIKIALEILGYKPCYHFQVTLFRPSHLKFWIRAKEGKGVDFKHFFRKYKATVDWPGCEHYRELMEHYPDAKVLLNVRDPEEWYDSMLNTIWKIQPIFRRFFPQAVRRYHDKVMWNSRFEGDFENREKTVSIYKNHIEEVKYHVPPERLLVYNVKEGWKPLCDFMGKPVPGNIPFPNRNDRKNFNLIILTLRVLEWIVPVLFVAVTGIILAFVFGWF